MVCDAAAVALIDTSFAVHSVRCSHHVIFAELGSYGGSVAKVEIAVRINHDKEVNRARYCPQNHFVIGTSAFSNERICVELLLPRCLRV
jgi:hypothetical protein